MDIPVCIISYNCFTYVKSMVEQLLKYTSNIVIIDNCSTYPPLIEYLKTVNVKIIRMDRNYGHTVCYRPEVRNIVGNKYIVTDPDLTLNEKTPSNFIEVLSTLSDTYKVHKVGLALDITGDLRPDQKQKISQWESQYWRNRIPHEQYELYVAPIDTTFCLVNFNTGMRHDWMTQIRIAGDFTCKHRPWMIGWKNELLPGELEYYLQNNISTTWLKENYY